MADEPTGNLDSKTGRAVLRLFEKLHDQGRTIIIVTHSPEVALLTQRVITLSDGLVKSDVHRTAQRVEAEPVAAAE
jgi:putative ABC transport system ATP-binding protein